MRDARVDAYIGSAPKFAQPVMIHLRELVHRAYPNVEEGMKWYVEWIVEAKRPETRTRRIGAAVVWIAEGKKRDWKYENC